MQLSQREYPISLIPLKKSTIESKRKQKQYPKKCVLISIFTRHLLCQLCSHDAKTMIVMCLQPITLHFCKQTQTSIKLSFSYLVIASFGIPFKNHRQTPRRTNPFAINIYGKQRTAYCTGIGICVIVLFSTLYLLVVCALYLVIFNECNIFLLRTMRMESDSCKIATATVFKFISRRSLCGWI